MRDQQFGERLRAFRMEHGYTQQDIATALGVAISTYRRYETENMLPQSEKLKELAAFYHMSIDQLVGIGTVLTFRYDRNDLAKLRSALAANDLLALQEALKRLQDERTAALAPPDIPMEQLEFISKGTLRTIQIEPANEHLVDYAADREMQLRHVGHMIHDGLYYLQTFHSLCTVRAALESLKYPFDDDSIYTNADIFRQGACNVFARVLSRRFGYGVYIMEKSPALHIFCKKGEKYIDIRGWTEDFMEFTADLQGGRSYTKELIKPYDRSKDDPDPEGEKFAEWIIDRNPQYYDV